MPRSPSFSPRRKRSFSRGRSLSRSPVRRRSLSRSRSPVRRSRSPVRRRSRSRSNARDDGGKSLYVSGLAARVVDEDLLDHFSKEGKVSEARVVLDPRTRDSRGFGFVDFEDSRDASNAVRYLNKTVLCGRVIMVEKAKRGRPRTPTPGAYRGVRRSPSPSYRRGSSRRSPSPYKSSRRSPSY